MFKVTVIAGQAFPSVTGSDLFERKHRQTDVALLARGLAWCAHAPRSHLATNPMRVSHNEFGRCLLH